MKRLAALVSAGLALAVAVAAAQALQAPPGREPVAPIELPTTATRDGDEAARPANVTATPDRTGPEANPAAPAMQPSADDDRTERRTPTRPHWSPAPSRGDRDDDDYEDEDHGDDD